ncbi:hypothetical protein LGK97_18460 [Clostridium sp. CS001]|uniref:hypothetical protein n=1 Tax=Clostridium sp. CS001 TaxID=2880648 RepID=UPI001CF5B6EE|nr:hypothetical protein [Clostridium sp. CS001]MCB2291699.1 hypothetical protein [Clostridium sp. CS001]
MLSSHKKNNEPEKREASLNYRKVVSKISGWVVNANQKKHKILKALLNLEAEKGEVLYYELEERCSNKELYPGTYMDTFKGNLHQMKTDCGNSNGKVFVIYDGIKFKIWDEVFDEIVKYKKYFI